MMAQPSRCDATLVAAARDASDVLAFAELVRRYQNVVFAVALSVVGDRALAEDAAQETFLRAWAGLDRLRDPTRVAPWLCGIARNVARTLVRGRAHEVIEDPDSETRIEIESDTSPLRQLMEREADRALSQLLARVPNRYRAPMLLHYGGEQSVAQIAKCLELSEPNVKKLLSRGRDLLRERADRFTELTSACRVPATVAIAVIATVGARSAAAQTTATGGAIKTLVTSGVAVKKSLIIAAAVIALFIAAIGYRLVRGGPDDDDATASVAAARSQPTPTEQPNARTQSRARLSGVVIDERTSSPLPGATVVVSRDGGGTLADTILDGQSPPAVAVSDAAGRFALEVSNGHFQVDAALPGYTSTRPVEVEIRTDNVDRVELRLVRGGVRVRGTITDIKGGPVAEAIVTAQTAPGEIPTGKRKAAITGSDGSYELWLGAGEYDVRAEHLAYAPAETHVRVGSAELREDLQLVPAAFIEGVVLERGTSRPVAGAIVFVDGNQHADLRALTDDEGRFRLQQLAAGSFALRARAAHQVTMAPNLVELDIGQTRSGVELWVDRAANVSGHVVGEDGRALAGAEVALVQLEEAIAEEAQATTDADGRFVIHGVAPGAYGVTAATPDRPMLMRRTGIDVGERDVSDLELVVKSAHVVRGRVVPARLATIEMARPGGLAIASMALGGDMSDYVNLATSTTRTSADGSFEIKRAAAGTYTLIAVADDGTRGEASVVVGRDEGVTIALAATPPLRGTIVDRHGRPVTGVGVHAESDRVFPDEERDLITDAAGAFVLRGFAPGTHGLSIVDPRCRRQFVVDGSPGQATTTITITDKPSEVRLVVTACDRAFRGTVVDSQGAGVADAWVHIEADDFRTAPILTDADGRFTATGLHDGAFVVTAYHPAHGRGRLESAATETDHKIKLLGDASLTVAVRQRGQPVVGFELRVRGAAQRSLSSRNADGTISVGNLPPGRYTIEALADAGTGAAELVVAAGPNRTIELELREWISVRGTLVGVDDGRPLAAHVVTPVQAPRDGAPPDPKALLALTTATTDAHGRFELRRVPPDTKALVISSPSGEFSGVPLRHRPGETRDLGKVPVDFRRSDKPGTGSDGP
ncbi:MAG: hypothetical protein H6Q90_1310 [Deltaproteobacteria bacterium]|nr:hypothetical protein [Deltaproteobacteria bacterium]